MMNSEDGGEENAGGGIIVGVVVGVAIVFLFFMFALPAIRGNNKSVDAQVNLPAVNSNNANGSGY